ncbi:MAG: hypothetical protein C0467_18500 [Planctomycetaceae bacterium]|nr:hypothetical protein [Planctomycetaceae bacterium]
MRRFAAFLLLVGLTQIPVWAGDYFMAPRSVFPTNSETTVRPDNAMLPTPVTSVPVQKKKTTKATTATQVPVQRVEQLGATQPTSSSVIVKTQYNASMPLPGTTVPASIPQSVSGETAAPVPGYTLPAPVSVTAPQSSREMVLPTGMSGGSVAPTRATSSSKRTVATQAVATQPVLTSSEEALKAQAATFAKMNYTAYTPAVTPTAKPATRAVEAKGLVIPMYTTPQVAAPQVAAPIRQTDYTPAAVYSGTPGTTGYSASTVFAPGTVPLPPPTGLRVVSGDYPGWCSSGCSSGLCDSDRMFGSRLLAWAFYQPTTRGALPILKPLPYVGPILAFRCDSPNGCSGSYGGGCGTSGCSTGACATGGNSAGTGTGLAARFGLGTSGRACKTGCVSPSDNVFTGYRFANNSVPSQSASVVQGGVTHTSYKPVAEPVPPTAMTPPPSKYYKPIYATDPMVQPASGDVLTRPFTRP